MQISNITLPYDNIHRCRCISNVNQLIGKIDKKQRVHTRKIVAIKSQNSFCSEYQFIRTTKATTILNYYDESNATINN